MAASSATANRNKEQLANLEVIRRKWRAAKHRHAARARAAAQEEIESKNHTSNDEPLELYMEYGEVVFVGYYLYILFVHSLTV